MAEIEKNYKEALIDKNRMMVSLNKAKRSIESLKIESKKNDVHNAKCINNLMVDDANI